MIGFVDKFSYMNLCFSLLSMVPDLDEFRKTQRTIYSKMCTIFSFVYFA